MKPILILPVLLAGLAAHAFAQAGDPPKPVNLLFVLSDQHRGDTLGCAGHPLVETPNLDRLAAGGVRFSNAIVQVGLCVPSRASLFTGTYPQIHRATNNNCRLPPDQLTWPELLSKRGYTAVAVGRVHGVYDGCEMVRAPGKEETAAVAEAFLKAGRGDKVRLPSEEH